MMFSRKSLKLNITHVKRPEVTVGQKATTPQKASTTLMKSMKSLATARSLKIVKRN